MTRIDSAAREFMRPLMSSSAATLVIFVPLAFLAESRVPSSGRCRSRWQSA
jgi:hypothetical protein